MVKSTGLTLNMLCIKMIKLLFYTFIRFFSDSKKALTVLALVACNILLMSFCIQQPDPVESSEIFGDYFHQENATVVYTVSDADDFYDNISLIIDTAQHNRSLSSGIYLKYHDAIIKVYTNLKERVDIWSCEFSDSAFFSYTYDVIFCVACILIFSFTIYSEDYILGLPPMTRSTKHGQKTLSQCKLSSVVLFSVFIVGVTTFTELILFGNDMDLFAPVQTLPNMAICPYSISVFEYLLISSFSKLLVCLTYVLICLLFICRSKKIIWGGFFSVCIAATFIAFSRLPIRSAFSIFSYIFPQNLSDARSIFSQYSAIACFNNIIPAIPIVFGFYIILTAVLFVINQKVASSYIQCACPTSVKIVKMHDCTISPKKRNSYSLNILNNEFYKCFISQRLYIIIVVAVPISIICQLQTPSVSNENVSEIYYREFISDYSGDSVDESLWSTIKSESINATATVLETKKMLWNNASSDFISGKISIAEYENILTECSDAVTKREVFRNVERYDDYLASCSEPVCFVYDTGWKFLFERSLDIPIYISVLLIASSLFTIETESQSSAYGMDVIIRTTTFGRRKTCCSKIAVSFFCCFLVYFCSELYMILYTADRYSLPLFDAPMQSITIFADSIHGFTLGQTFLLYELIRFVGILFFSLLFSGFSHLIKNSFISIICGVILISVLSLIVSDISVFLSYTYLAASILSVCISIFCSWKSCAKWGID